MTTVFGSLFILVIFSFLALKIKKTFAQKKKGMFGQEITNDLIEEFSDPCHSEEFIKTGLRNFKWNMIFPKRVSKIKAFDYITKRPSK